MAAVRGRSSSLTVGSAMAAVAFASGFISFTHICALTLAEGQSWKTAHLMPLCIDGQIVIGSAYFMGGKNWRQKAGGLLLGVLPGITESLIANWESGIHHGLWAAGWATVPAQAFAFSTFLFERWLDARKADRKTAKSAEGLLADALAEIAGLHEAVAAAGALADAALAAIPRRPAAVPEQAPAWPQRGPVLPLPVPALPQAPRAAAPQPPAAPARAQAPRPAPAPAPAHPGPLKSVPAVAAAPRRERRAGDPPAEVMAALPQGEAALRALFDSTSANEVARIHKISRYWAAELRRRHKTPEGVQDVA
jgi:hypothetical protein